MSVSSGSNESNESTDSNVEDAPVISKQPGANDGIAKVEGSSPQLGNPAGGDLTQLQVLSAMEYIFLKQQIICANICCGFAKAHKYDIFDAQNRMIFNVAEQSGCCSRLLCCVFRGMTIDVIDPAGNIAISLERPFRCTCCTCSFEPMIVSSPPGTKIGSIMPKCNCYRPLFHVQNENDETVFIVNGKCCERWTYRIFEADGVTECGLITQNWTGFLQEMFTAADNYGVQFPPGIGPAMKAVLIGAAILLDLMYNDESKR